MAGKRFASILAASELLQVDGGAMRHCLTCGTQYGDEVQFCSTDGTALVAVEEPQTAGALIGKVLDKKYKIEKLLGEGGMGVVYQATHIHIESTVAVKVLHKELVSNPQAVERFRREARASGRIHHPHAISVIDFGVAENNIVYIVMEYLEGMTLSKRIRQTGRVSPEETVRIMRDVCAAVDAAHRKGIIHRDLKPDNIMLQRVDGQETVKVLDFGIAQLKSLTGASMELTQQGTVIGTPFYMSPEQCVGKELDPRSDIYSLGVILFEMLTGRLPFKAESTMAVIIKHTTEAPPRLRQIEPAVPVTLEVVTLRALAKSPAERQASAAALARELENAIAKSKQRLSPVAPVDDPYRTVITGDTHIIGGPAGAETDVLEGQVTAPMVSEADASAKTETVSAVPSSELDRTQVTSPAERRHTAGSALDSTSPTVITAAPVDALGGATEIISPSASAPSFAPKPRGASGYETNIMPGGSSAPIQGSAVPYPASPVPSTARGYTERIGAVRRESRRSLYVSIAVAVIVLAALRIAWSLYSSRTSVSTAGEDNTTSSGPAIPANMLRIPAASFTMGSKGGERVEKDEMPAHQVSVGGFYIGKYEVTNREYQEFVLATGHKPPPALDAGQVAEYKKQTNGQSPPPSWQGTNFPPGEDSVPVTQVSWADAVAYCNWLSKKIEFQLRLPTEEEWEYAAKGTGQRVFPWGNEFDPSYANSLERTQASGFSKPLPLDVNKYAESKGPFGTVSQAGNVAEWTASDAKSYPGSTLKPIQGSYKIYRGGSFLTDKYALRTTARFWGSKDLREPWLGFRVAMDLPAPK